MIRAPGLALAALLIAGGVAHAQPTPSAAVIQPMLMQGTGNVLYDGAVTGTTTASILVGSIPVGAIITHIDIFNTTANAVTGGINVGSTSTGTDIASAAAVGANARVTINAASSPALAATWFSMTVPTTVYFTPVTSWNSASLAVWVFYDYH